MTDRREVRLGDVADLNWGDTKTTKAAYVPHGFRAFSASGPDGWLPWADYDRIGVVVSAIGADCGKTWLAKGQWSCIKNTIRFFSSDPNFDTEYLYWATRDPGMWPRRGSAQPFISQGDARNIRLMVPSLAEQRAIVGVLGALDDKIESNGRQVALINSIIPLIFKRQSRDLPTTPLPRVAAVCKGVSYRSADIQECDTAMVTLKSIDRNGGYKANGLKPYAGTYKEAQVLRPGDFVVAQTDLTQGAEVIGRVVLVPRQTRFQTLIASLDLVVIRPIDPADHWYLYAGLIQDEFREHCRSRTSGTTVLHLGSDAFSSYQIPWADTNVRSAVAAEVEPLVRLVQSRGEETDRLAALRDALLPELLSGRLHVREAEKAVEGVL